MQLIVESDGTVRCVYGEECNLQRLGLLTIRRGSHVEPTEDGRWTADLAPVGGPALGPFQCQSEALAAEAASLEEHWLAADSCAAPSSGRTANFIANGA